MKDPRTLTRTLLLLAAMAGTSLLAADQPDLFDLKLHAGLKSGELQKDHLDNKAMGFAIGARHPWGKGQLTAELSFDILPGQATDTMPTSGAVYGPGGAVADPVSHNAYFLRPNESIDWRKESSQGFSLKGGYAAAVAGWQGLSWQAGLSIDAYKTSSEFTGTLRPMVYTGA